MRIREVFLQDFRSFQGARRISFVDPLTDSVRPITVIAGTNGTGKTTILEVIEALSQKFLGIAHPSKFLNEIQNNNSSLQVILEADRADFPFLEPSMQNEFPFSLYLAIGNPNKLTSFVANQKPTHAIALFLPSNNYDFSGFGSKIQIEKLKFNTNPKRIYGGLLYFPHDRQLTSSKGGPIEAPPEAVDWLYHYSASDKWAGSLEQLWVWQNYLDLEAQALGKPVVNLKPFIETIDQMLGTKRSIWIEKGRVWVTPPNARQNGHSARVQLAELPSGEQQLLLLVGELARRRRKGGIIMIDEPELSLHPTLQRRLLHYLRTFAREWDSQIILCTHSLEILRTVHESERIILDQLEEA